MGALDWIITFLFLAQENTPCAHPPSLSTGGGFQDSAASICRGSSYSHRGDGGLQSAPPSAQRGPQAGWPRAET